MSLYQKMTGPDKKNEVDFTHDNEVDPTHDSEGSEANDRKALTHPSYEELENQLNAAESATNEANNKVEEYKAQWLRASADLENIRRRAEKDISNAHKYALERIITDLLPVIDSLERGLSLEIKDNEMAKSIQEGLEMTRNLFLNMLEKFSVKAINPYLEPFNPELHQAISTIQNPENPPNTVIQVLQKGYQLHDRLLRPALVIVAA